VTSPTYTYLNEYQISGSWYAHLDLYRGDKAPSAEELGLADARLFRGVFVEWPPVDAAGAAADPYLAPTHVLEIAFARGGAARTYRLKSAP
jgi:tRNA A37 threonylcarbamoyladenosine biosynthesis protein TsaE